MAEKLQPVRGTHDILPSAYSAFAQVIETAQQIAERYGYARMDTPMFEFSDVFHRAVGETSDIVSKETYTFTDRGGESITLRPEFTAAIVRSYLSNGLQQFAPFKAFYAGPAFRYERPQKGRMRQFHQFGCELLGAAVPTADVEMIALAQHILNALGIAHAAQLEINTLGDSESRTNYRSLLVEYLSAHRDGLSEDSKLRLEKNPLRVLDSKSAEDQNIVQHAPKLSAALSPQAQEFFAQVEEGLARLGIAYTRNERLVRGLDYYNHTVFEFTTDKLGAQATILAGGRYDGLVEMMGGPATAGIGFAAGVERLIGLREALAISPAAPLAPQLAIIPLEAVQEAEAMLLAHQLRHAGYRVELGYAGKAAKRLQRADKAGVKLALMLGENEVHQGTVTIKHLAQGTQHSEVRSDLLTQLPKLLGTDTKD